MKKDNDEQSSLDELTQFTTYRNADRTRGILTKSDRQYLLSEKEVSGQEERNLRYRMRQRVVQSLLDIALLSELYPDEELMKIFDHDDIYESIVIDGLLELAYRSTQATFDDVNNQMETRLEKEISNSLNSSKYIDGEMYIKYADVTVDLNVEVEESSLTEIIRYSNLGEDTAEFYQSLQLFVYQNYDESESEGPALDNEEVTEIYVPESDTSIPVAQFLADAIEKARSDKNE